MKSEEPSFGAIFPIISKKLSNNPNRDSKISEKWQCIVYKNLRLELKPKNWLETESGNFDDLWKIGTLMKIIRNFVN